MTSWQQPYDIKKYSNSFYFILSGGIVLNTGPKEFFTKINGRHSNKINTFIVYLNILLHGFLCAKTSYMKMFRNSQLCTHNDVAIKPV